MTSKLSFRARALDATKGLPIYHDTEITETADCSAINRTVPQMPTGMEKEEESEHHLQRAICTGTTIPTPEVFTIEDLSFYGLMYPADYKTPRQLIYMQPFSMEADIPDYDVDSEDEQWINSQSMKLELTPDKFEEMMDRLEKGSGQTVVTLQEAKALIKEDDDLIIAVYDYWLNKRLKTQHHLIPQVRTEARYGISNHNPYIAFRRRTEKMQTRKNRKNDESSYEKMLKLKRDLSRAVTLLEMVKRREKSKRELLHLSIEVFEKRYQCGDYAGQIVNEAMSQRPVRPSFTPLYPNNQLSWITDGTIVPNLSKKEKRQYNKRRHKSGSKGAGRSLLPESGLFPYLPGTEYSQAPELSSDEDIPNQASPSEGDEEEEETAFQFKRRANCDYHPPTKLPRVSAKPSMEEGTGDKFNFCPTSISKRFGTGYRFAGYSRRRIGRGGRTILDRSSVTGENEFMRQMGYSVFDSAERESSSSSESPCVSPTTEHGVGMLPGSSSAPGSSNLNIYSHFRPQSPPKSEEPQMDDSTDSDGTGGEDEEEEDCNPPARIGVLLGAHVSHGDQPMLFDIASLFNDPEPHPVHQPAFLSRDIEQPPRTRGLLDKGSANLCNMHHIQIEQKEEEELEINSDSYIPSLELGGTSLSLPFNFDLDPATVSQCTDESMSMSTVPIITLDDESENTEPSNVILATFIEDSSAIPAEGSVSNSSIVKAQESWLKSQG